MENLGSLALLLAFCLALYAVAGSVVGRWKRKPFLVAVDDHGAAADEDQHEDADEFRDERPQGLAHYVPRVEVGGTVRGGANMPAPRGVTQAARRCVSGRLPR